MFKNVPLVYEPPPAPVNPGNAAARKQAIAYWKNTAVVLMRVSKTMDKSCPSCDMMLIAPDYQKRRCMGCHTYMVLDNETIEDVVQIRSLENVYTLDLTDPDKTRVIVNRDLSIELYA